MSYDFSRSYVGQFLKKYKFSVAAVAATWLITWTTCSPHLPSKHEPEKPYPKDLVIKTLKEHEYRTAGITMNNQDRYVFEEQKDGSFKNLDDIEKEQNVKNQSEQLLRRHGLEKELGLK